MLGADVVVAGGNDAEPQSLPCQVGNVIGTSTWEYLTGPLREDGLNIEYYTADGTTTTDPRLVTAIRITLRGESAGRTLGYERMQDTVSLRVGLRNCDPNVC